VPVQATQLPRVVEQPAPGGARIQVGNQCGDLFAEACPSPQVLRHVTSRWGVLVLVALLEGTHRFSELRRKVGGVSERVLAQTLQWLESDGFVLRQSFPVVPPHGEYSRTPLGRDVGQRAQGLANWIEVNLSSLLRSRSPRGEAPSARPDAPWVEVAGRFRRCGSHRAGSPHPAGHERAARAASLRAPPSSRARSVGPRWAVREQVEDQAA